MKTVGGIIRRRGNKVKSEKIFITCNNLYKKNVYCNLETICAVPPYGLTVHQISENCRRSNPETKCGQTDGQTDTGGYTMIPRHYRGAGYKHVKASKFQASRFCKVDLLVRGQVIKFDNSTTLSKHTKYGIHV